MSNKILTKINLGMGLIVLPAMFGWTMKQRMDIRSVESAALSLEKKLIALEHAKKTAVPVTVEPTKPKVENFSIDQFLFEKMQSAGPAGLPREEFTPFYAAISQLNDKEALDLLEKVKACELPRMSKDAIFRTIIPPLSGRKGTVLMDFCLNNQEAVGPITAALYLPNFIRSWILENPIDAIKWADQKRAAGLLDSKNDAEPHPFLLPIEEGIFRHLMDKDFDGAVARLKTHRKNDAILLLHNLATNEKSDDVIRNWASLVRGSFSPIETENILADHAENLSYELANVDHFMQVVQANASEKNRCVETAATDYIEGIGFQREVEIADVEVMREWVSKNHDHLSIVTGLALGDAISEPNGMSFDNAAELLIHYHNAVGDDQIIVSFLTSCAKYHVKEAREVAESIKDEALRNQVKETIK